MNNVLLDELPTYWNGYEVNTWFQIGIQVTLVYEDSELEDTERNEILLQLLFGNDDGSTREFPTDINELKECIGWFMNGWYHDNKIHGTDPRARVLDYNIDQWRIYADFLHVYHIDLNTSEMHWWMFQGLLWNMPKEQSSFMQVLEIRQKKPRNKASMEEKKAIEQGHKIYDLKPLKKAFNKEEKDAIDAYDKMMAEAKKKKIEQEALQQFNQI